MKKNLNSQGFTERTRGYSVLTVCSYPRGGSQKEAMTSGSREGLLAEDDKNPEQIADLLLSQISHFKTFLCISSESKFTLF